MEKIPKQDQASVPTDLQYVSLQAEGRTYGGWYRVLADGQMELLALANIQSERRAESTPVEQARGMLADFVRTAQQRRDGKNQTLGHLLYADATQPPVPEGDWIDLVQSVAARDQIAMRTLYERTYRIVFTLLMRLANDPEIAEKLTVDVFHEVWRRAPSYDPARESVVAWIMNQTRSMAVDHLMLQGTPGDRPSERSGRVREALTTLAPDQRQAIETAFFSQLGYAEVAARLQQPAESIKTSIRQGLQSLQETLRPGGEL